MEHSVLEKKTLTDTKGQCPGDGKLLMKGSSYSG